MIIVAPITPLRTPLTFNSKILCDVFILSNV